MKALHKHAWMLLFVISGGVLWLPHAAAVPVNDLFQQGELVTDQSATQRQQAVSQALATVLVRVSGSRDVLQDEDVQAALSNPLAYLDAYRYEASDQRLPQPEGDAVAAKLLVLNFSRRAVEKLLRRSGLPVWPSNRPNVLVWLVKDDLGSGRQLLSGQLQAQPETQALAKAAQERGVPITQPLLDAQDRAALNADQVWRMDAEAITEASRRYQADAILVGRISQTSSGRWLSDWSLWHAKQQPVFDAEGDLDGLMNTTLGSVSEYFSGLYGVVTDGSAVATVALSVDGISDFDRYMQLLNYLQSLELVKLVQLQEFSEGHLQLQLQLEGDVDQLKAVLQLDRRLIAQPQLDGEVLPVNQALLTQPTQLQASQLSQPQLSQPQSSQLQSSQPQSSQPQSAQVRPDATPVDAPFQEQVETTATPFMQKPAAQEPAVQKTPVPLLHWRWHDSQENG